MFEVDYLKAALSDMSFIHLLLIRNGLRDPKVFKFFIRLVRHIYFTSSSLSFSVINSCLHIQRQTIQSETDGLDKLFLQMEFIVVYEGRQFLQSFYMRKTTITLVRGQRAAGTKLTRVARLSDGVLEYLTKILPARETRTVPLYFALFQTLVRISLINVDEARMINNTSGNTSDY